MLSPKKYFYTLRGLLAAKWLTQIPTRVVPVKFDELYKDVVEDREIVGIIEQLLRDKRDTVERHTIKRIVALDNYIVNLIEELKGFKYLKQLVYYDELDELFRSFISPFF